MLGFRVFTVFFFVKMNFWSNISRSDRHKTVELNRKHFFSYKNPNVSIPPRFCNDSDRLSCPTKDQSRCSPNCKRLSLTVLSSSLFLRPKSPLTCVFYLTRMIYLDPFHQFRWPFHSPRRESYPKVQARRQRRRTNIRSKEK